MNGPIFKNGKFIEPNKEKWVDVYCPVCNEKILSVNIKSYLHEAIKSISCSKCGLGTQNWTSWIKKKK